MAITVEELQILISAEYAEALKGIRSVQRAVKKLNEAAAAPAREMSDAVKQAAEQASAPVRQQQEAMKQAADQVTAPIKQQQAALKEAADFQAQTAKDINDAIARMFEKQKSGYTEQIDAMRDAVEESAAIPMQISQAQQEAWEGYLDGQAGIYDVGTDPGQLQTQKDANEAVWKLQARIRAERELRAEIEKRVMAEIAAARAHMTDKQRWMVDNPTAKPSDYPGPTQPTGPAPSADPAPIKAGLWNEAMRQYYAKLDYLKAKLNEIGLYGSERMRSVAQATGQATGQTKRLSSAIHNVGRRTSAATGRVKGMMSYITSSIKRILVTSAIRSVLRGIFDSIATGIKNIAQYSKEANATMSNLATGALYLKNSIGSGLMPIIQAVAPAIQFLMDKLSALFNMIGMLSARIFHNATTFVQAKKAAVDYAQTVKGVKNQLAGFDELNVLTQQKPGMPSVSDMFETVAIPQETLTFADNLKNAITGAFKAVRDALKGFWDKHLKSPFEAAWGKIKPKIAAIGSTFLGIAKDIRALGKPISEVFDKYVGPSLGRIVTAMGDVYAGVLDSFNLVVADLWDIAYPAIESFINNAIPVISEFSAEATEAFSTFAGEVKRIFDQVWKDTIKPVLNQIGKIWDDLMVMIKELWDKWGATTFENVKKALKGTGDTLMHLWESTLKPIYDKLIWGLGQIWEVVKPVIETVWDLGMTCINTALDIYNEFVLPIVNWLIDTLGPGFSEGIQMAIDILVALGKKVFEVVEQTPKDLQRILDFIAGSFTGEWSLKWENIQKKFEEVWGNISTFAGGVIEKIKGFVGGLIEKIKEAISKLMQLDRLRNNSIGKGGNIGDRTHSITTYGFASGAVVTQPTLAWTGEYAGAATNPEIIAPQSIMRETVAEANAPMVAAMYEMATMIVDAIERSGVEVSADSKGIFKAVQKEARNYHKTTGVPAFG